MKKNIKAFLLIMVLGIGLTLFTGCNNNEKQFTVSFMTAYNITYTEATGINCEYAAVGGKDKKINDGCVIGSVDVNTQYGAGNLYKFDGWYTEEECLNQWDLYRDEVRCDLTLYAKYVRV